MEARDWLEKSKVKSKTFTNMVWMKVLHSIDIRLRMGEWTLILSGG